MSGEGLNVHDQNYWPFTTERKYVVMMGHRERLHGGDEFDALTRGKRFHRWRAGVRAWIKRRFNKRQRKLDERVRRHRADARAHRAAPA